MQRKFDRQTYILLLILSIFVLAGVGAGIYFANQDIDQLRETVMQFLKRARSTRLSLLYTIGIYIAGGLLVFPVTIMNLATSMVFGPLWGLIYSLAGSLSSAATLFTIGSIGRHFGLKSLFSGKHAKRVDEKLEKSGVAGIAMLGFVPIAPYSLVALCAGLSSVHFIQFICGAALALLPGGIARSFLGDSFMKIFLNPSAESLGYVAVGFAFWLLVLISVHFGIKKYTQKNAQ